MVFLSSAPDARAPGQSDGAVDATPPPPRPVRSLRWWGALAAAVLLVPVLSLIGADIALQRQQTQARAEREMLRFAQYLAAEVDAQVRDHARVVGMLASRVEFRRSGGASCDTTLDTLRQFRPEIASIALIGLDGRMSCPARDAYPPATYEDRTWFQAIARGEASFRDRPQRDLDSGRIVVPFAFAVTAHSGALMAVLVSSIDLDRLPLVGPTVPELPGGLLLMLVDRQGQIVPHARGAAGATTNVGDEVLGNLARGRSGWRGPSAVAADSIVGAAPLTTLPLYAVAVAPASRILTPDRGQTVRLIMFTVLLLAGTAIVTLMLHHRLMQPIRALVQVAEGVAEGNLGLRVPERSRTVEFGRIAVGINTMLKRLAANQAALVESEGRLRTILEAAGDPILVVDRRNVIRFASPACESVLGWHPDELVGRGLCTIQPARLASTHLEAMSRHVRTGTRSVDWGAFETVARRRDGREIPVEIAFGEIMLDGEPAYAGFLRDISTRRDHERLLRETEAARLQLLDAAPAMIWTSDAQGHTVYASPRMLEYLGTTLEEVSGCGWLDFVHPADRVRVRELVESRRNAPVEFTTEYRLRRADGAYRWCLDQGGPRLGSGGEIEGSIGCCVDIHSRIETERRLRRRTAIHEVLSDVNLAIAGELDADDLMQHVCDSIVAFGGMYAAWIHALDATGTTLEPAARACFTQSLDGLRAVSVADVDASVGKPILRAFRTGGPQVVDRRPDEAATPEEREDLPRGAQSSCLLPLCRDGVTIGVLTVASTDAEGFDAELVDLMELIAADVSFGLTSIAERMRRSEAEDDLRALAVTLEERIIERTRSLEVANRELEAFSYSVSHDLRAPLRAIRGFTELVLEGAGPSMDATHRGYLDRVLAASRRMSSLIDDLLDLSRVTRAEIRRRPVDVTALAREILAELVAGAPERRVETDVAPGLVVDADPGLTRTVLVNLLGNAWKFTARADRVRIEVRATELDGQRAICVRDNGAGFDVAHAHKLFAPFQRLHSEREFEGSGIGLALVHRIVSRHGGRVVAHGAPGLGATFVVSFGDCVVV